MIAAEVTPGDLRDKRRSGITTQILPSIVFTSYVAIGSLAGPAATLPSVTLNREPCHGQHTTPQASTPSASGPPRCVQWSSKAAYPSSVRAKTMRRPPAWTSIN